MPSTSSKVTMLPILHRGVPVRLTHSTHFLLVMSERTLTCARTEAGELDTGLQVLYIYGEMFGGMYPGLETPATQTHIQKGIYYSPTYGFFAFDMHDGHGYLDYDVTEKVFKEAGFFYAEALLRFPSRTISSYPSLILSSLLQGHVRGVYSVSA